MFMRHERKPQAMRTAGTRNTSSSHHTQPASGINHTLSRMMTARTAAAKMIHLTISATKKIQWCRSVYRIVSLAPSCCFRYSTLTGPPSRSCRLQPITKVGRRNAARAAGEGGGRKRAGPLAGPSYTGGRTRQPPGGIRVTLCSSHTLPYSLRRPGLLLLIAGLTVLIGLVAAAARPQASAAAGSASITAYRGLGTWVDMYDSRAWDDPAAAVKDMALHGVRTLYIETANYHNPQSASMFKPAAMTAFIQQCHALKIKIVAWYLPGFTDLDKDYKRSRAAIDYRTADGQKFDSFALDIEASIVKPASTRSARLKTLSAKLRKAVGKAYPLGGIIPSPAGMKINSSYWPGFPYKAVAEVYDVIVAMGYYTYHGDGYSHAYNETRENVRIVREQTGRPTIPIHVIAGVGSKSSVSETRAYVRALRETGCLGGSMYDWATTSAANWLRLASVPFNKVQTPALPMDVGYAAPLGNCRGDTSHPKEVFYQALKQNGCLLYTSPSPRD